MNWGEVELEPEVEEWIDSLDEGSQATVAFYIDLLGEQGVLLGEPYTRQLDGKLRELRFHLDREVFRKRRMREFAEVKRARRAMERCIAKGHTVDEEQLP